MAQAPPPQIQDFHLDDGTGLIQHLLQLDPVERAAFLPQGFLDLRILDADPDAPPVGRVRTWRREDGVFYQRENTGPITPALPRIRDVSFNVANIGKGATAPTEVTIGTTPTVSALRFDAINETATIAVSLRADMDLTKDFTLRIQFALANAQGNGDQLDVKVDYVVWRTGATGNGPGKTSTRVTQSLQVTTAEGLAVNDVYAINLTIPFDDLDNPLNAEGAAGIACEFSLGNVTGVAAILALDAALEYAELL